MENKCKKTDLKTVEKCELNAEQIKKALECCNTAGGKMCKECPYCRDEYFCDREQFKKDTFALVKSQEQKISELTEKNEALKAENALLLNMQVVDDCADMRIKINLPEPLKSSEEEYVINRQETIKLLTQKNKELTEENERLRASSIDYRNIPDIESHAYIKGVEDLAKRLIGYYSNIRGSTAAALVAFTVEEIKKETKEKKERESKI